MVLGRRHLTLKRLMIDVAAIGVGVTALLRPNKGWAVALPVLFLTTLLTAILGVLVRRGHERASWVRFALFGWAYLILVYFWHEDIVISNPLSTKRIFKQPLVELLDIVMVLGDGAMMGERLTGIARGLAQVDNPSRFIVAWSLLGLLFAGLGGLIARWFSRNEPTATG
jgi:hypothetical protein